jgi:hypothetical protein
MMGVVGNTNRQSAIRKSISWMAKRNSSRIDATMFAYGADGGYRSRGFP